MITLANTQEKLEVAFPELPLADIENLAIIAYNVRKAREAMSRGFTTPEAVLAEYGYVPGDRPP